MDQSFPVLKLCSSCTSKEEAAAYALPLHQFSRHLRQVFWEEMTHSKLRMSSSPLLKKASFYFKINKAFILTSRLQQGGPQTWFVLLLKWCIQTSIKISSIHRKCLICLEYIVRGDWNGWGRFVSRSVIVVEKRVALVHYTDQFVLRGGGGPESRVYHECCHERPSTPELCRFFFRHATPLFLDVASKNCLYNLKQSIKQIWDALNESLGSRLVYFWSKKKTVLQGELQFILIQLGTNFITKSRGIRVVKQVQIICLNWQFLVNYIRVSFPTIISTQFKPNVGSSTCLVTLKRNSPFEFWCNFQVTCFSVLLLMSFVCPVMDLQLDPPYLKLFVKIVLPHVLLWLHCTRNWSQWSGCCIWSTVTFWRISGPVFVNCT